MGGSEHAAEGGRLGARQGANRGDRGGGTVLVKGPLVVNQSLLTGSEERSIMWSVLCLCTEC